MMAAAALIAAAAGGARADADVTTTVRPERVRMIAPASVDDAARAQSDRGRELYERGDYQGASEAYREAYRLRPSPGVLFNLGQSYRQDGRCEEAAVAYRAVLASDLAGPARDLAEQQLDAVETCIRAIDRRELRAGRSLRRGAVLTMAGGGAALVLASGLALADDGRGKGDDPIAVGFAIGGGAAVATGAVLYAIAQHRLHAHARARAAARAEPQVGIWRVPVGTTRVAGLSWRF
ncbi:MAG TPA: tetratricopeptide repeat protein [Kofleriaceae bacterium]|nr:tetratricopeptide repeat protein [Kofleriaceae bacterium]